MKQSLYICLFLIVLFAGTAIAHGNDAGAIDFKKDQQAAQNYGATQAKLFLDKVSVNEKRLFDQMIQTNFEQVKELNRRLDQDDDLEKEGDEANYQRMDEALTALFTKKNGKRRDSHYIYAFLTPQDLGLPRDDCFDAEGDIDPESYTEFVRCFQYAYVKGYLVGSLYQRKPVATERIILKVKVPQEVKMIYVGDSTVLLKKDLGIMVNKIHITNEERQYIKVEAEIVPKAVVTNELKASETKLNQRMRTELGLDRDCIQLTTESFRSNLVAQRAESIIDNYFHLLPKKLLKELFTKKHESQLNKLTLNFEDRDAIEKDVIEETGCYDIYENKLSIDLTCHQFSENVIHDDLVECEYLNSFYKTSMHELGHAIDSVLLGVDYEGCAITDPEFINLFEQEAVRLTEETSALIDDEELEEEILYGLTAENEYFAEVFAAMKARSPVIRTLIWQQVPMTCHYIATKLLPYQDD